MLWQTQRMPKRLRIKNHLSGEELEARYFACQEVAERVRWQVIWLLWQRTLSEYVANHTHLSVQWIRSLARNYNTHGPSALSDRRRQHPGPAPLLTSAQKQQLVLALQGPVPAELGGGLWNGPKVAAWMSQQIGRKVHTRRGHVYLRQAGYSCQSPRPHHHQGDPAAQEDFRLKKSSKKTRSRCKGGPKPGPTGAGVGF